MSLDFISTILQVHITPHLLVLHLLVLHPHHTTLSIHSNPGTISHTIDNQRLSAINSIHNIHLPTRVTDNPHHNNPHHNNSHHDNHYPLSPLTTHTNVPRSNTHTTIRDTIKTRINNRLQTTIHSSQHGHLAHHKRLTTSQDHQTLTTLLMGDQPKKSFHQYQQQKRPEKHLKQTLSPRIRGHSHQRSDRTKSLLRLVPRVRDPKAFKVSLT